MIVPHRKFLGLGAPSKEKERTKKDEKEEKKDDKSEKEKPKKNKDDEEKREGEEKKEKKSGPEGEEHKKAVPFQIKITDDQHERLASVGVEDLSRVADVRERYAKGKAEMNKVRVARLDLLCLPSLP